MKFKRLGSATDRLALLHSLTEQLLLHFPRMGYFTGLLVAFYRFSPIYNIFYNYD